MENNEQRYCYIDIKLEPSFYENVLSRLNSSKYLTLTSINGKNCLCFIMDKSDINDKSLKYEFDNPVYPFIFINDKKSKMFIDVVTSESYPYETINKGIGDYITEVIPSDVNLTDEEVKNFKNRVNFSRYNGEILKEFERIVTEAYKLEQDNNRANR